MSLRDKLRGLRVGDTTGSVSINDNNSDDTSLSSGARAANGDSGSKDDAAPRNDLSGTTELTEFAPRQDGDYHCAERGLHLRFARPIVTESDSAQAETARGEFTTTGRFAVQRRFSRPIVYTVLDSEAAGYDAVLTVRRTDTETRSAERLEFAFEADAS